MEFIFRILVTYEKLTLMNIKLSFINIKLDVFTWCNNVCSGVIPVSGAYIAFEISNVKASVQSELSVKWCKSNYMKYLRYTALTAWSRT